MHTITVVIPAFNAERTIGEAIQSVLDQTFQDFEIIVVDDASNDSTVESVRMIKDQRVRLLRHDHNMGPADSRNNAFMNARGKWVCILDADDLLAPSYMETMLARATERNEVFLAAGIEVFSANSANKPLRERIHQAKAIMHDRNSDSLKFVDFLNLGVDIKPFFPLAVVRDNEIKQVGLGSEWLEFIANLFRSGLDLVLVDEPLYFYRVHGSNFSSRYEQVNQDIEACDRLLASVCLSVDEREALISKRRGYMRHRPWKALHRGMLLRGFLDFLQAPGSIVQGCALLRFEIAKRLTKRKLGHGQECA